MKKTIQTIKDKNIVIAVDLQDGFLSKIKENGLDGEHIYLKLFYNLFRVVNCADEVIATQYFNKPNNNFHNILEYKKMVKPEEQELNGVLYTDKLTIIKKTQYGFDDNRYLTTLKKLNGGKLPKQVFLCGVDIDGCVLAIAHQLFANNIKPILIKEATYSSDGSIMYDAGIMIYHRTFGSTSVISLREFHKFCLEEEINISLKKYNNDYSKFLYYDNFDLSPLPAIDDDFVDDLDDGDLSEEEIANRLKNGENKPIDEAVEEMSLEERDELYKRLTDEIVDGGVVRRIKFCLKCPQRAKCKVYKFADKYTMSNSMLVESEFKQMFSTDCKNPDNPLLFKKK